MDVQEGKGGVESFRRWLRQDAGTQYSRREGPRQIYMWRGACYSMALHNKNARYLAEGLPPRSREGGWWIFVRYNVTGTSRVQYSLVISCTYIYIYWYKLVPTVIWPTQGCHSTCSSLLSNELPYISFRAFSHPRHHPPIFSILASVTTTALYLSPSHSVSLRPFSCPHSVSLRHSSCAPYYQINATASPFPLLYRSFSIYLPIIIRASSLQRSYFFPYFSYSSFYRRHHCFGMIYIFFI